MWQIYLDYSSRWPSILLESSCRVMDNLNLHMGANLFQGLRMASFFFFFFLRNPGKSIWNHWNNKCQDLSYGLKKISLKILAWCIMNWYHDFSLCYPSIQLFSHIFISDMLYIFTFLLIIFSPFTFNKLTILWSPFFLPPTVNVKKFSSVKIRKAWLSLWKLLWRFYNWLSFLYKHLPCHPCRLVKRLRPNSSSFDSLSCPVTTQGHRIIWANMTDLSDVTGPREHWTVL